MDMTTDLFAEQTYGKIALQKMAPVDPNFRLYEAGWMGEGNERDIMEVKGALFRPALRGQNKGKLSVIVRETSRKVYVTSQEMDAFDAHQAAPAAAAA
jgi:hypothetical protein